jgi:hypothetical protein
MKLRFSLNGGGYAVAQLVEALQVIVKLNLTDDMKIIQCLCWTLATRGTLLHA